MPILTVQGNVSRSDFKYVSINNEQKPVLNVTLSEQVYNYQTKEKSYNNIKVTFWGAEAEAKNALIIPTDFENKVTGTSIMVVGEVEFGTYENKQKGTTEVDIKISKVYSCALTGNVNWEGLKEMKANGNSSNGNGNAKSNGNNKALESPEQIPF